MVSSGVYLGYVVHGVRFTASTYGARWGAGEDPLSVLDIPFIFVVVAHRLIVPLLHTQGVRSFSCMRHEVPSHCAQTRRSGSFLFTEPRDFLVGLFLVVSSLEDGLSGAGLAVVGSG